MNEQVKKQQNSNNKTTNNNNTTTNNNNSNTTEISLSIAKQGSGNNNISLNYQTSKILNGSLNFYQRKKELELINQNNKVMLKALKEVKPVFNRNDWEEHSRRHEELKNNIQKQQNRHLSPLSSSNIVLPSLRNSKSFNKGSSMLQITSQKQIKTKNNQDIVKVQEEEDQERSIEGISKERTNNENNNSMVGTKLNSQFQSVPITTQANLSNAFRKNQLQLGESRDNNITGIKGSGRYNSTEGKNYQFKKNPYQENANNELANQYSKLKKEQKKREQMTKSVPRGSSSGGNGIGKGYFNHVINSPLMQLGNFPASIMKRISNQRGMISTNEQIQQLRKGSKIANTEILSSQLQIPLEKSKTNFYQDDFEPNLSQIKESSPNKNVGKKNSPNQDKNQNFTNENQDTAETKRNGLSIQNKSISVSNQDIREEIAVAK